MNCDKANWKQEESNNTLSNFFMFRVYFFFAISESLNILEYEIYMLIELELHYGRKFISRCEMEGVL